LIKIKVKYFLLFLFLVVAYCFNTQPKKKNTFIIYDPLNPINTIQPKKDSFQRIEFNFEIDPFPYFEDSLSYAFINEILDQVKYDTREDYFSDDLSSSSLQYLISEFEDDIKNIENENVFYNWNSDRPMFSIKDKSYIIEQFNSIKTKRWDISKFKFIKFHNKLSDEYLALRKKIDTEVYSKNYFEKTDTRGCSGSISVPIFNKSHTQAIVEYCFFCNGLIGGCWIIKYKKINSKWIEIERKMTVIS
jgi:hypothetical protein